MQTEQQSSSSTTVVARSKRYGTHTLVSRLLVSTSKKKTAKQLNIGMI